MVEINNIFFLNIIGCGCEDRPTESLPRIHPGSDLGQELLRSLAHEGVRRSGVQVPVVGPLPAPHRLRRLLSHLRGAQGLVLVGSIHALWIPPHLRYFFLFN